MNSTSFSVTGYFVLGYLHIREVKRIGGTARKIPVPAVSQPVSEVRVLPRPEKSAIRTTGRARLVETRG